jgi:putative transposase
MAGSAYHAMTQLQSALLSLLGVLRDTDENDMMRQLLGSALQMLIDAEATAHIRAAEHERTASRTTQSNGARDKEVATAAVHVTVKMN